VSDRTPTASATRQQLLILCAASPDLLSPVVAWSLYDGAGDRTSISGDEDVPPYDSVLAAMRDGWRVMQLPATLRAPPGTEHETSFLKWEYVLERIVDVH
jgi:hypothetical protein